MSFEITFKDAPDYIHATVTGTNSRDAVAEYLIAIRAETEKRDCFRVLIEELLEGPRLGAMEVFSLASEGSMKALGKFEAIAYVDPKMGKMAEFAETIAVNRGMPVSVFNDVDAAREWLVQQKPGASEQKIFLDSENLE